MSVFNCYVLPSVNKVATTTTIVREKKITYEYYPSAYSGFYNKCLISRADWLTFIHTYIQFIEASFPGLFSHNILTKTN